MVRTPVDPAEQEVLNKELWLMAELLEKLTDLKARRRASRRTNNMNVPRGNAYDPSSSVPPPSTA